MSQELSEVEERALDSWYRRRYHEMVQNSAFQERIIKGLQTRVEQLEQENKSLKNRKA